MLAVADLLLEAETELCTGPLVKSALKVGILVSLVQTALDTYRPGNVAGQASDLAVRIVTLLTKAGALDDLLKEKLIVDGATVGPARPTRDDTPVPPPASSLTPEEAIAHLGVAGLLSPEEQALLRDLAQQKAPPPAPPDLTDPAVVARTDEDLAAAEARTPPGLLPFPSGFGEAPEDFFTNPGHSVDSATS